MAEVVNDVSFDEPQAQIDEQQATTDENNAENDDNLVDSSANALPPNVVEGKDRWWIRYLIAFAVLSVFAVLVAWARGAFATTDRKVLLSALCDAFSVPGVLGISFGMLIVVSNGGAFDIFAYAIRSIFLLFKKDPLDRKYGGYHEYRQAQQEKKRTFWYLIIVGAVFLAVGIALLVWHVVAYR